MEVETVAVSELSNDPANVRQHSEAQISKLAGSLRRWGQTLPLLVDQHNVVRIGNARLEAARRLGWQHVQIVRLMLSPSEWTALAIADNRLHDESTFDSAALSNVLDALRSEDAELATATGYTLDEIASLLGGNETQTPEPPADFPTVDENIQTDHQCPKCGYVWSGSTAPAGAE